MYIVKRIRREKYKDLPFEDIEDVICGADTKELAYEAVAVDVANIEALTATKHPELVFKTLRFDRNNYAPISVSITDPQGDFAASYMYELAEEDDADKTLPANIDTQKKYNTVRSTLDILNESDEVTSSEQFPPKVFSNDHEAFKYVASQRHKTINDMRLFARLVSVKLSENSTLTQFKLRIVRVDDPRKTYVWTWNIRMEAWHQIVPLKS